MQLGPYAPPAEQYLVCHNQQNPGSALGNRYQMQCEHAGQAGVHLSNAEDLKNLHSHCCLLQLPDLLFCAVIRPGKGASYGLLLSAI